MSNIDKHALRQHAEHIIELEGDESICHRVLIDAYEKSDQLFTAQNVMALLDELEAKDKRIAELEAREINLPPYSFFDFKLGSQFKSGVYCHIDSLNTELSKHGIKMIAAAAKGE